MGSGGIDVAPGILEKGLLLELRFQLDQYINLRPVKLYPGVETPLAGKGPDDIDFVEWSNDYQHYLAIRLELEKQLENVA